MATIGTGSVRGSRRELNQELALVPFIDFLLCLVAFLLVTAVWSQMARLQADAKVPGSASIAPSTPATELHVTVRDEDFRLVWQQGQTVLESSTLARHAQTLPDDTLRYPELERAAAAGWATHGSHRGASDAAQDRAVLHTPNSLEFREMTAVLDALHGPKRVLGSATSSRPIPAFAVALATD
jgi:biopolymer transport protein ExbD